MKKHQLLKFRRRLIFEGSLKAFLTGLSFGAVVGSITAIALLIFQIIGLKIVLIVFGLTSIVASFLLYFFKYHPKIPDIATRVDQTGLDERVVTMLQYEKSDSEIINLQRQDAKTSIDKTPAKNLKFTSFKIITYSIFASLLGLTGSSTLLAIRVDSVYTRRHNIAFNSNGGSEVASQIVIGGQKIIKPEEPNRTDYRFLYWYEDDVKTEYDFQTLIFASKQLNALWIEKTNEDKIIEKLIDGLRLIVDRAKVSDELKADLHQLIDDLVIRISYEDSLTVKLAKIEEARQEIIARILAEIDPDKIILIGEALQEFTTTYNLGTAVLAKDPLILENAINQLILELTSLTGKTKNKALIQTADDIEEALEISNENNPELRQILEDLAEYLRTLVEKLEDGDIPEDSANDLIEEKLEEVEEDIQGTFDNQSPEEDMMEEIDQAFQDALDELTGKPQDNNNDDDEENDKDEDQENKDDEGDENGEGTPLPKDKIPTIIDGETSYLELLEALKAEARDRLSDPNLSEEERAVLNNYIRMIDAKIENEGE